MVGYLREVVVGAVDHFHAVLDTGTGALDVVGPQTKAGQVGRDAGHVEGHGLQRGVAPGLVVGGEDAEVVAQYGVVVAEIDDAVVAREVAGHEDEFHVVLLAVGHVEVAHHADHLVVVHVAQPVGEHGVLQRRVIALALLQTLLKVGPRPTHPAWHGDEGDDGTLEVGVVSEAVHRLDEDVEALVAKLVAS